CVTPIFSNSALLLQNMAASMKKVVAAFKLTMKERHLNFDIHGCMPHQIFSAAVTVVKGVWGDQVPLQDLDFQKYFTEQGIVERSAVFYRKY
ncbi:unnamed protein product, partial [Pocillopora meandrina]